MRNREVWAYLVGIALSVAGGVGSVFAFNAFAPGLISPTAIRWLSLIVFGGAGIAAAVGLFMVMRGQAANPVPARPTPSPPRPAASNPPPTTSGTDDPGS